jgi:hypothetical protein
LIGRDYTDQLFLNRLPPEFEFRGIDACEAWILGLEEGDEIAEES